ERRDIISLRLNLIADGEVRSVEAVHRGEALEDIVGDAVHDLLMAAVHDRVQAAERAEARRGAGTAEKAVALDQNRRPAGAPGRERGRDPGRTAAEHDDLVLAEHRRAPFGLSDMLAAHRWLRHFLVRTASALAAVVSGVTARSGSFDRPRTARRRPSARARSSPAGRCTRTAPCRRPIAAGSSRS